MALLFMINAKWNGKYKSLLVSRNWFIISIYDKQRSVEALSKNDAPS